MTWLLPEGSPRAEHCAKRFSFHVDPSPPDDPVKEGLSSLCRGGNSRQRSWAWVDPCETHVLGHLLLSNLTSLGDLVKMQILTWVQGRDKHSSFLIKFLMISVMLVCRSHLAQDSKWNIFNIIETFPARIPEWLCGVEPYIWHVVWVWYKCGMCHKEYQRQWCFLVFVFCFVEMDLCESV